MSDLSRRVLGAATLVGGFIWALVPLLASASSHGLFASAIVRGFVILPWYAVCFDLVIALVALLLVLEARDATGAGLLFLACAAWVLGAAWQIWGLLGHTPAHLANAFLVLGYLSVALFAVGALRSHALPSWMLWAALVWVAVEAVYTGSSRRVLPWLASRPYADTAIPLYLFASLQMTALLQILYGFFWMAVGLSLLSRPSTLASSEVEPVSE